VGTNVEQTIDRMSKEILKVVGCQGLDRMVVGFMTIYAISAYHN